MREGRAPELPDAVAWPRNRAEVRRLLDHAAAEGLAVVPYGAGSGVCGGASGRAGSLVIDTKRLDRILAVDGARGVAHVEAGVLGQHLEDALEARGFRTGHSPSSILCSTVGGWVAARSAGQFSSRYGVFDDMLLAAHVETPAGPLDAGAWTPAGADDLLPAIAGSEGALGVVTDVLVRIAPVPEARWLRGYAFPDLDVAWEAMRRLMQAELWPSVLRLYDPVDTRVGGRTGGRPREDADGARVSGLQGRLLAGARRLGLRALPLPLAIPGLVNRLAAGLAHEVLLVVGFEGPRRLVEAVLPAARRILETDGLDLGAEPGEHWMAHRHDVSYKLAPIFANGAWADTMEVAAPWSRLAELDRAVREALGRHAVVMAHYSHAYPEGCSIYFSFAGAGDEARYDAAWAAGLEAVRAAGGTVTHHHGVGVHKSRAAARELGPALRAWWAIKNRLDPDGLMNPGRPFPPEADGSAAAPAAPARNPPAAGPVLAVDERSLLATVAPDASPEALAAALARRGLELRVPPPGPLVPWLAGLRRGELARWEVPLFGLRVRFPDGAVAEVGVAPRSAAGPDLRQALLRRALAGGATVEHLVLPVRRVDPAPVLVRVPGADPALADQVRPARREGDRWTLVGPAAAALAEALGEPGGGGGAP